MSLFRDHEYCGWNIKMQQTGQIEQAEELLHLPAGFPQLPFL
jgi:hypothetical protein